MLRSWTLMFHFACNQYHPHAHQFATPTMPANTDATRTQATPPTGARLSAPRVLRSAQMNDRQHLHLQNELLLVIHLCGPVSLQFPQRDKALRQFLKLLPRPLPLNGELCAEPLACPPNAARLTSVITSADVWHDTQEGQHRAASVDRSVRIVSPASVRKGHCAGAVREGVGAIARSFACGAVVSRAPWRRGAYPSAYPFVSVRTPI